MKKLPKLVFKYFLKTKQRVGLTTHFAAHREKSVDLKEKNITFCSFNPFVVGSTPARPTKKIDKIKRSCNSKCFFYAQKYLTQSLYTQYEFRPSD